ncbi:methyltransferase-like protein 13 [Tanacetum coccineum]|uniref:Methyltransferase-like protein 13 n=1 Tax=Tanacetum coccineum TaxID=301880 RepID=A0ABQ5G1A6_9ASTR
MDWLLIHNEEVRFAAKCGLLLLLQIPLRALTAIVRRFVNYIKASYLLRMAWPEWDTCRARVRDNHGCGRGFPSADASCFADGLRKRPMPIRVCLAISGSCQCGPGLSLGPLSGVLEPLFFMYVDDVVCSVVVDKFVGAFMGEFVVEDVKIGSKEFRRRLRFRRMPNLIESQARLVASFGEGVCETYDRGLGLERMKELKGVEFRVDTSVLVHPYLTPMVCGLFLIVGSLNERIQQGFCLRALCLGVGGGALLSFFSNELGFEVVGVEADEVVLSVARQYFRLNDGKSVQVIVGDAIEMIEKVTYGVSVDGVMRSFLHDHGVLVINVISPNKVFYGNLVRELQDFFYKVYEMDVANDGNVVLMATLTPITSDDHDNAFLTRLKSVISGTSVDSIVEL